RPVDRRRHTLPRRAAEELRRRPAPRARGLQRRPWCGPALRRRSAVRGDAGVRQARDEPVRGLQEPVLRRERVVNPGALPVAGSRQATAPPASTPVPADAETPFAAVLEAIAGETDAPPAGAL